MQEMIAREQGDTIAGSRKHGMRRAVAPMADPGQGLVLATLGCTGLGAALSAGAAPVTRDAA